MSLTRQQALAAYFANQVNGGVGQSRRPAPTRRTVTPPRPRPAPDGSSVAARVAAAKAASKKDSGGGGGFPNPLDAIREGGGLVLGGALKAMDVVGNVVPAMWDEAAKALPDDVQQFVPGMQFIDEERIREDDRGVLEKITDPEYGAGSILKSTGNEWGDRFTGLVGDLAGDPLTYVGGAGVKAAAGVGKAGRRTLAQNLYRAGYSDDVVAKAGRTGAAYLDDATREAGGAARAGLYFGFGKGAKRIPLSGPFARGIEKGASSLRANTISRVTEPVGRVMRSVDELKVANQVLDTGKTVGGLTPRMAAARVAFDNDVRAAAKTFRELKGRKFDDFLKAIDRQSASQVTDDVELGRHAEFRQIFDELRGELEAAGIPVGEIPNYAPHRWTDEARRFFEEDEVGKKIKSLFTTDPTADPSPLRTRVIAGKNASIKLDDGTVVKLESKGDQLTIKEINEQLQKQLGVDFKFMEDDIRVLTDRYITEVAEAIGIREAFGNLAREGGDLVEKLGSVTNEQMVKLSDLTGGNLKKQLERSVAKRGEEAGRAMAEAEDAIERLRSTLEQSFDRNLKNIEADGADIAADVKRLRAELKSANTDVGDVEKHFASMRAKLAKRLEKLSARQNQLDNELAAEELRIAGAREAERGERWQRIAEARRAADEEFGSTEELVARIDQLESNLKQANETVARLRDAPPDQAAIADEAMDLIDDEAWPDLGMPDVTGGREFKQRQVDRVTDMLENGDTESAVSAVLEQFEIGDLDVAVQNLSRTVPVLRRNLEKAREARVRAAQAVQARTGGNLDAKLERELLAEINYGKTDEAVAAATRQADVLDQQLQSDLDEVKRIRAAGSGARQMEERAKEATSARESLERARAYEIEGDFQGLDAPNARLVDSPYKRGVSSDYDEALAEERLAYRQLDEVKAKYAKARESRQARDEAVEAVGAARAARYRARRRLEEAAGNDPVKQEYLQSLDAVTQAEMDLLKAQVMLDSAKVNRESLRGNVSAASRTTLLDAELDERLIGEMDRTLQTADAAVVRRMAEVDGRISQLEADIAAAEQRQVGRSSASAWDEEGRYIGANLDQELDDAARIFRFLSDESNSVEREVSRLSAERKRLFPREAEAVSKGEMRWGEAADRKLQAGDPSLSELNQRFREAKRARNDAEVGVRSLLEHYGHSSKEVDRLVRMIRSGDFNEVIMVVLPENVSAGSLVRNAKTRQKGVPMTKTQLVNRVNEKFPKGISRQAYLDAGITPGKTPGTMGHNQLAKLLGGKAEAYGTARQGGVAVADRVADRRAKAATLLEAMKPSSRKAVSQDARQMAAKEASNARIELAGARHEMDELVRRQQAQEVVATRVRQMGTVRQARNQVEAAGAEAQRTARLEASRGRDDVYRELTANQEELARRGRQEPFARAMFGDLDDEAAAVRARHVEGSAEVSEELAVLGDVESQLGRAEAELMGDLSASRAVTGLNLANREEAVILNKSARDAAKKLRKKVPSKGKGVKSKAGLSKRLDELDELMKVAEREGTPGVVAARELHRNATEAMARLDASYDAAQTLKKAVAKAKKEGVSQQVTERVLPDGFAAIEKAVFPEGADIAVKAELARAVTQVQRQWKNEAQWWKYWDEMNQTFKAYATMTPGFHVRNWMSATFMNMTEGVGPRRHFQAMRLWRKYVAAAKSPKGTVNQVALDNFWNGLSANERAAFQAVFGSGTGGAFDSAELGRYFAKGSAAMLKDNLATKGSRKVGVDLVEGPVRLALAMDVIENGGTMQDALQTVTRIHFDYSQVSEFDRNMKRLIPFWTFMSRNIPLQVEQMVHKPRAYAIYQHAVNNFDQSEGEGEFMPQWMEEMGGFVAARDVDLLGGKDLVLNPDLPHLSLRQEAEQFFPNPVRGVIAQGSPYLKVPIEMATNHNFFFDGPLFDQRPGTPGGPGAAEVADYMARSILPTYGQGQRLLGAGRYEGRDPLQTVANYGGLPVRGLGDRERDSERRRREYLEFLSSGE